MARKLETASHVAVIIACLFLCVTLVRNYVSGNGGPHAVSAPAVYEVGDQFPSIEGLSFAEHEQTVVLVVRSTCRFCTESLGFYRQLIDSREPIRTQFVAVTDEPTAVCADYLRENGVGVDQTIEVQAGSLKIRGTPTVVLLDRRGVVRALWSGRLPPEAEDEVVRTLG